MTSSFVPRGFVRSWKDLAHHLRWSIQEGKVKNLQDWFYTCNAPMYLPRDLQKIEKNIFGYKGIKTQEMSFQPIRPTVIKPYYRYILNPHETENGSLPAWYLIYWPPKVRSQIHSHPEGGCVWWLLQGELHEFIHSPPQNTIQIHKSPFVEDNISNPNLASQPHQMMNGRKESISLHVYWNGLNKITIPNTHHHTK